MGREGIEFYPQELLLFKYEKKGAKRGTAFLRNLQVERSKYHIPVRSNLLETKYLYPLVKGPAIKSFEHDYDGLIVAFPYEKREPCKPVSAKTLRRSSPLLLDYYKDHAEIIKKQTKFSDKIRGLDPGEFYGLARTGPYSFAKVYVAFRDNSTWCATVVSAQKMPWGTKRRFLFQNHAVSICETVSGHFITEDAAHYICAIMNAPIVERFIYASSDERSFKIRPQIFIPTYNPRNRAHRSLAELSKQAHRNASSRAKVRQTIEKEYLKICRKHARPR